MSRAARLLELMQCLRRRRHPVNGATLAGELGISLRTLYRDIASLQAQGAHIEGEPGMGYVLRSGFLLPPLMFTVTELEALTLGARWVADRTDNELAQDARNALAKIGAVLPDDLQQELHETSLLVGPPSAVLDGHTYLPALRRAIRLERKLAIRYLDLQKRDSERLIWPIALGFFDHVRMVVAWCELRQGLRHFRVDRLIALDVLEARYPKRRRALLKEWQEKEGITAGQ
nr:YafY family protein [Pararobbsia alpina]